MATTVERTRTALSGLWPGFRDTFVSPGIEPAVDWDGLPRRPRFLSAWLRHPAARLIGMILLYALVAATASSVEPWSFLIGLLAVAPFAVAQRNLIVGWRIALVLAAVAWFWYYPGGLRVVAAVGLAVYTFYVSLRFRREVGLWAWAATVPVAAVLLEVGISEMIPLGAVFALLTDALRSRRQTALALVDQQEMTDVERARRIGVEERTRVARELHDVVAHHMSMVAVRAETAPFRLSGLSDEVRNEFAEISQAARESLNEIRSLLSVLRSEEAPRMPQPGLEQIEDLVASTRDAGVEVSLTVQGEPRPLRESVEVSAYRILQEALSNATRHAPGEEVEVWVEYGDTALELMVANPCPAPPSPPGHGLTGMAERATAVGGSVSARRRADGRFVVEASLPVEQ